MVFAFVVIAGETNTPLAVGGKVITFFNADAFISAFRCSESKNFCFLFKSFFRCSSRAFFRCSSKSRRRCSVRSLFACSYSISIRRRSFSAFCRATNSRSSRCFCFSAAVNNGIVGGCTAAAAAAAAACSICCSSSSCFFRRCRSSIAATSCSEFFFCAHFLSSVSS